MIKLINLSKNFEYLVFKNINYTFEEGYVYSIFGKNGVGKTTLLNIISGDLSPNSGKLIVENYKNDIAFIGESFIPFEFITGLEFIRLTLEFKEIPIKDDYIETLLKEFDIFDFRDKMINTYSRGMKYKILIILIILLKPKILILDEPFIDIDLITLKKVKAIFKKMKVNSIIIFSTHIPNIALELSDKILYLTQKDLIEISNNFINIEELNNYIINLMDNYKEV